MRFIRTSSVSQLLRASRRYLLLKPISVLSPEIETAILSLALPRAVTAETFISSSSNTHLRGLLIFSVIIIDVLSIESIKLFVFVLTVAVFPLGNAVL